MLDLSAPLHSFGPYRVTNILGRGGMGVVYRGEHLDKGEPVAIKTVHTVAMGTLASIRREVHALSRIRHPGIVRIVAEGVSHGLPWYAMELLQGQTLRGYLLGLWGRHWADAPQALVEDGLPVDENAPTDDRTATLPDSLGGALPADAPGAVRRPGPSPLATLSLMRRLCLPLAHLHGSGLVHRDLKPENIFIRPDGTLVLVDLGIAAQYGGGLGREVLEPGGKLMGSHAYMAPEQIRGEFVDARADLYALGCLLYELLCGRPPFIGNSATEVLYQHLDKPPVPPSHRVEGVSEALDRLVLKLLEKRPQNRLGYAVDVAALLESLGAERPSLEGLPEAQAYLYRSELAGREAALQVLTQAVEQVSSTTGSTAGGRCILMGGESGVGKTRLVMELLRMTANRHLLPVTGQCVALGVDEAEGVRAAPLHPLRPLLVAVADRCREYGAREAERLLGPQGKVLAVYEPALAQLPFLREQPEPPVLSAQASQARLLRQLQNTLFALARDTPVLLVLDDLQWADELSLNFLRELTSSALKAHRVLLVGTYRMEETSAGLEELMRAPGVTRMELQRLDEAHVGHMVSGMLALRTHPAGLLDFLFQHCDGNPFFIAEYLRTAISEGVLARSPTSGEWQLQQRAESFILENSLPVPRTLAELIQGRLRSLDTHQRALVHLAAVLGREFDASLLMTAGQLEETAAMEAIELLRVRQIVEEPAPGRLRFVHDKLRELTYEQVPEPHRRGLHRRAAELMESRSTEPDSYPVLAHHFARAHVHDKASSYFSLAGDRARETYANRDAITFFRAAISELRECPPEEDGPRGEFLARLHESLGDVLALLGAQDEARDAYAHGLEHLALEQRIWRSRLQRKMGKTWETRHLHEEALKAHLAAMQSLGERPPAGAPLAEAWQQEWVQIQIDSILVHYWMGQVERMSELVEKVRSGVEAHGTPQQQAQFFDAILHVRLRRERYRVSPETMTYARRAMKAGEESADLGTHEWARFMLAFTALFHGALREAEAALSAGLLQVQRAGDVTLQGRYLTYLTLVYRMLGQVEETQRMGERSLSIANAGGMPDYVAVATANLAWVDWRARRYVRARERALAARALWRSLEIEYPFQWTALLPLTAIHLEQEPWDEAMEGVRGLLAPSQQQFPEELAAPLTQALASWDGGEAEPARESLRHALRVASLLGYL